MRSISVLIRVVLIAAFLTSTAMCQDNAGPQLRTADSPVSSPPISGSAITFDAAPVSTPSLNPNSADPSLQQEYLKLAQAKAELMDDAALKREIQQTQKNIGELRALQRLQEAQRLLLSLKAEFPDSEAATKATQMLNAMESFTEFSSAADDLGPPLNTAAGEPFHRSSFSREVPGAESQTAELPRLTPEPDLQRSPSREGGEPRTISTEVRTFGPRVSEPKPTPSSVYPE